MRWLIFIVLFFPVAALGGVARDSVEAGVDDCDVTGSTIRLTNWVRTGYQYSGGLRFRNVQVPQGATVDSAWLELYAKFSDTTSVGLRLRGEDTASADSFSTASDYNARTKTTAYIDWSPPIVTAGQWYRSPDISSVVQEIINRADWVSGNPLVVFLDDTTSCWDCYRDWHSFEEAGDNQAKLIVYYTVGSQGIRNHAKAVVLRRVRW